MDSKSLPASLVGLILLVYQFVAPVSAQEGVTPNSTPAMVPTFAKLSSTSTSPEVQTEQRLAQQLAKQATGRRTSTLRAGQALNRGKSLFSRNGSHQLILQNDGNLVLYSLRARPRRGLWSSKTNGQAIAKAIMQRDCNFVLYRYDGSVAFSSRTNGKGNRCYLSVQNDGNVVVYSRTKAGNPLPVWATNTVR